MNEGIGGRKVIWTGPETDVPDEVKKARAKQERQKYTETLEIKALREKLSKFDFPVLKAVFSEMYSSYGLDPTNINFFEIDEIGVDIFWENSGAYSLLHNRMDIASYNLRSFEEAARVLAHEQTHAIGFNECIFSPENPGGHEHKSGYSSVKISPHPTNEYLAEHANEAFNEFNEAVTDSITLEILEKYFKRVGKDISKKLQTLEDKRVHSHVSYEKRALLLEGFISRMSEATGTPQDQILWAIKSGYFSGEPFFPERFREYVEATLGENYTSQLANGRFNTAPRKRSLPEKWIRDCKAFFIKRKRKLEGR